MTRWRVKMVSKNIYWIKNTQIIRPFKGVIVNNIAIEFQSLYDKK